MANAAFPGFYPARPAVAGGSISYVRRRAISGNSVAIGTQDAVKADSNGDILSLGASSTHATAVDSVAMGASYVDSTGARITRPSLAASTTYSGSTVDPTNASYVFCTQGADAIEFRCSVSASGGIALTNLRNNYDINLAGLTNGISGQELRGASAATTSTLPFRLTDFVFASDNNLDASNHTHIFAMINRGQLDPSLGDGTGV